MFLIASAIGGATTGGAVGCIGALVGRRHEVAAFGLGCAILLVGLDHLRYRGGPALLSSHWLVPRSWGWLGSPAYEALFGLALGAGVVTVVPFAVFHVLLLVIVVHGKVAAGAFVMLVFGLTRAVPLLSASSCCDVRHVQRSALEWAGWMRTGLPPRMARVVASLAALLLLYREWIAA